jgi:tetratricopeptide (TPR) repeat protein
MFQFHDAIRNLPGSTPAVQQVVETSLDYLRKLEQSADLGAHDPLWLQIGQAYIKLGDIQALPGQGNLGDLEGGKSSFQKARDAALTLLEANPEDREATFVLASATQGLAEIQFQLGELSQAIELLEQALEMLERTTATDRENEKTVHEAFAVRHRIADFWWRRGNPDRALAELERAISLVEPYASVSESPQLRTDLATALGRLGQLQAEGGDDQQALETMDRARRLCEELVQGAPENATLRRNLAIVHDQLARVRIGRGEADHAAQLLGANVDLFRALCAADPSNVQCRRDAAISLQRLGDILLEQQRWQEALATFQSAEDAYQMLVDLTRSFESRRQYAIAVERVARALLECKRFDEALGPQRRVIELREELHHEQPDHQVVQQELAFAWDRLSETLSEVGRPAEALTALEEAVRYRRELLRTSPDREGSVRRVADNLISIGDVLAQLDRAEEAVENLHEGLAMRRELAAESPTDRGATHGLADALHRVGIAYERLAQSAPSYRSDARAAFKEGRQLLVQLAENGELNRNEQTLLADLEASLKRWEDAPPRDSPQHE